MSLSNFIPPLIGPIILWSVVALLVIIILSIFSARNGNQGRQSKPIYKYGKKKYIMTEAEQNCFYALVGAVGDKYYVFPQIHLPNFLEHKMLNQDPRGAFRHIDEKSVDFILCTKQDLSVKLAIELDDLSHERPDRQQRDREVERILKEAQMPLLRLKHGDLNSTELIQKINQLVTI